MKFFKIFLFILIILLSNLMTARISYFLGNVNCDSVELGDKNDN